MRGVYIKEYAPLWMNDIQVLNPVKKFIMPFDWRMGQISGNFWAQNSYAIWIDFL
jgi:hypothetical protein